MASVYVMFELGARWGSKRYLVPIMIGGTRPSNLKAPLSGIHAVRGTSEADLHQLISDMGAKLKTTIEGVSVYQKALRVFINEADVSAGEALA